MPNFVVTQANASLQFDRWFLPDRMAAQLKDVRDLFTQNTPRVRQDGGYVGAGVRQITQWVLAGANLSNASQNVAAGGRLWVRITANAGNWDIHVYKAVGAASEVANAINVAAGAAFTLTAQNASGLTGSGVLSASAAAIAADSYSLQVYLGWEEYIRQVFNGTQQEDGAAAAALLARVTSIGATLDSAVNTLAKEAESDRGSLLTQLGRIWSIPAAIGFLQKNTQNDVGVVTVVVDGVFERLRQNWKDNGTAQSVAQTTLAAGAAAYASSNQGVSTAVLGTIGENLEPGTIQAVCSRDGPDYDDTEFDVTFTPSDGTGPLVGRNKLVIGKTWDDPDIPLQISTTFGYSKTGADTVVAPTANVTGITGLTTDNSDAGKLYGYVRASGLNFIYEFYSASSLAAASLVAKSPAVAANTSFIATSQRQSGIQVGWKSGSGPADTNTFTITIQPHKKGDSTHAPDQFTIAVTRSAKGWIQDHMRENHGWKLNSSGAPTFADSFGQQGALILDGGL